MTDSPERGDRIYQELRTVRDRVDEVLGVVSFIAQDPDLLKRHQVELRGFFGRSKRRAEVFLNLSPDLNVTQIATKLGMKRQNVSSEVKALERRGLVRRIETGGRGEVYVRQAILEQVRLTQHVRDWFPQSGAGASAPDVVDDLPDEDVSAEGERSDD